MSQEKGWPVKLIEVQVEKFLLGKVLTIIDASYSDIEQRNAVKDLIKQAFHTQVDWMLDRKSTKNWGETKKVN